MYKRQERARGWMKEAMGGRGIDSETEGKTRGKEGGQGRERKGDRRDRAQGRGSLTVVLFD